MIPFGRLFVLANSSEFTPPFTTPGTGVVNGGGGVVNGVNGGKWFPHSISLWNALPFVCQAASN